MNLGRVLAFDYGTRRIGVAVSDALRITAGPLEVVATERAEAEVRRLAEDYAPDVIVVGLPVGLSGREGPAAEAARAFAGMVANVTGIPVEMVDERFTTHTAEKALIEGGMKRRDRRATVDKVAAAVILQQYLERR
jgi:putative Holliday junction resolvase